jgi:SAM-dependent methyltransferase
MTGEHGRVDRPSTWVERFAPQITPGGLVLDLACGGGRHAKLLAAMGYRVLAVDRDAGAFPELQQAGIETLQADLEGGFWPLAGRPFAGVVVTNYLHRPLFEPLLDGIGPDGVLIYETFARGNERYGRPASPQFLLEPGELLRVVAGRMRVLAYEDLFVEQPKPAMVQRICARRET